MSDTVHVVDGEEVNMPESEKEVFNQFLPINSNSPLIQLFQDFLHNSKQPINVKEVRNILISKENELSDAQLNRHAAIEDLSESESFFQSSRQQDAHEALLKLFKVEQV